jgi:MoxR-like ATPase
MRVFGLVRQVVTFNGDHKHFIYPYYEITNEGAVFLENRKEVFRNKGSIFFTGSAEDIAPYLDKIICVEVDLSETAPLFDENNPNACKYSVSKYHIVPLKADEMIEVIKIDKDIEQIIYNDYERQIKVRNRPINKKVLLEIGDYIYGCFDYIDESDEEGIKIRLLSDQYATPEYSIKKYKKEVLSSLIKNIKVQYESAEYQNFIYSVTELNSCKEEARLDFIEDNKLINKLRNILKNEANYTITNTHLNQIKNAISSIRAFDEQFWDERIKRLLYIQNLSEKLLEFKSKFMESYFNSSQSEQYKDEYIRNNPEVLKDSIAYELEIQKHERVKAELLKEIENKKRELEKLKKDEEIFKEQAKQNAIEQLEKEKQIKQRELEEVEKQILNKNKEYDDLIKKFSQYDTVAKLENYIAELQKEKDKLNQEVENCSAANATLRNIQNEIKNELKKIQNNFHDKLLDLSKTQLNMDLFETLNMGYRKSNMEESIKYEVLNNIEEEMDLDTLLNNMMKTFESINRRISREDLINYLISITQNFITVMAGNPGTGKTSLCNLLAKTLGIYNDRFLQISVERGWTSPKDLIGYYNPISGIIEKSSTGLYDLLYKVNLDRSEPKMDLPCYVLLDEANLSSIEHYWSRFMSICDDYRNQAIILSNEHKFYLSNGFRFLATINYDHTTENLSPRFLDRASVILVDNMDAEILSENFIMEKNIKNSDRIISQRILDKYFKVPSISLNSSSKGDFDAHSEFEMNQYLNTLLNKIYDDITSEYKYLFHISPRTNQAIRNYCIVAQKYLSENNRALPLDYAIAQHLLPMIDGYGEKFKKLLETLRTNFEQNGLSRSLEIINKIISVGEQDHGYYKFFCR